MRTYGNGGPIVVVGVMPHQGTWEGHVQGEAVQADCLPGGRARDVRILNWREAAAGEPCDAETVMHGSERDGGKRASDGTSPAVYSTISSCHKFLNTAQNFIQRWQLPYKDHIFCSASEMCYLFRSSCD